MKQFGLGRFGFAASVEPVLYLCRHADCEGKAAAISGFRSDFALQQHNRQCHWNGDLIVEENSVLDLFSTQFILLRALHPIDVIVADEDADLAEAEVTMVALDATEPQKKKRRALPSATRTDCHIRSDPFTYMMSTWPRSQRGGKLSLFFGVVPCNCGWQAWHSPRHTGEVHS
jgi:hypothetical protein